ncbi:ectonucleotide pyrophosphatase/phosphodiesterase family member 5 [Anabrus simplex]|uniref:ectonucleotide pyrophosphatase/phosphodiesterase family member 5 n=1 Tax=Anabrus simplex TaxID=316456 RepID=UPI0035A26423
MRVVLSAILLLVACVCARKSAVLVVSFDGFRYNYFEKKITPFMDKLKTEGSHAEYMKNVFPTKTYPNHHSMATGFYPGVHGVLQAKVYDTVNKKILDPYELFHYNEEIIPIWSLNEQSPGSWRHSGVMMWPSGDMEFQGRLPTFHQSYNYSVPWEERVDTVMNWFTHPQTAANLVFMYFEDPDRHSHVFGPESPQVTEQIRRVDNITRYIYDSLKENNLSDTVNVLLVSDHGMETVTKDKIIDLSSLLTEYNVTQVGTSPVLHLFPSNGTEDKVYCILKNLSNHEKFTIYRKAELPERWHFKENKRAPPLLLLADEGYAFHDMYASETYYRNKWKIPSSVNMTFGVHGYDPMEKNMQAFFMAWGPDIKKNYDIPPFGSVDIHPLVSKLVDISLANVNGSLNNVISMTTFDGSQLILVNVWLLILQIIPLYQYFSI